MSTPRFKVKKEDVRELSSEKLDSAQGGLGLTGGLDLNASRSRAGQSFNPECMCSVSYQQTEPTNQPFEQAPPEGPSLSANTGNEWGSEYGNEYGNNEYGNAEYGNAEYGSDYGSEYGNDSGNYGFGGDDGGYDI